MRRESDDSFHPGQPALIVTYGSTKRKHQPLDRDVLVVGRAPSCDINLVSPEVAPVHCLIHRLDDNWCIRDCSGGRHSTRVNGRAIHEEILRDADVVQIGSFTFEARLPASRPTPAPGSTPVVDDHVAARLKRLQRSRRNLIRLALRLRQRARRGICAPPALAELEHQAECLRRLQRDYATLLKEYESRMTELEKAERDLCDERAAFERQCTEWRMRLDRANHEIARRRADAELQIKQHWEECRQQASSSGEAGSQELIRILDRRSQELNCFARHLRRCQQQLHESSAPAVRVKELQEVCASLHRDIADRDAALEKLRRQTEQQSVPPKLDHSGSYERELNAFRLELESDRQELNEQLYRLQVRQAEMEAAAREAELQRARERAALEGERAELTRLHEEIRVARDRTLHEGHLRDRMANIHRLKQELAASSSSSAPGDQLRPAPSAPAQ